MSDYSQAHQELFSLPLLPAVTVATLVVAQVFEKKANHGASEWRQTRS
jgi:hypothetical protein